uniref:Uncharacterized protein n=1 Tax=Nelumbo nucifera TaxID=4432 RepID=A0A822XT22_NELNU|nr:TPA_asm: hypothetical protein HUJ06_023428 [Nelumbo nucifera]
MTMENSTTAMAPFLLRNLITSIFIFADKSLLNLSERYKLLQFIRYLLIQLLLFFFRFLPSIFPSLIAKSAVDFPLKSHHVKREFPTQGDSGIARALSQILSIINDIPVSSRKYETVRNLAENLIDENLREGCESLRKVNQSVLSTAFARTLCLLERAMSEQEREQFDGVDYSLNRVLRVVRSLGDGARARLGVGGSREDMLPPGASAEKLAAELLWLAEKLAACRSAEEAVWRWGSASDLARLALSAPPRLQGSLVKVSGT